MPDESTDATVVEHVPGKVVVSINSPTPLWATWVFRIFYGISTAVGVWLAATNVLSSQAKFEILLGFTALDRLAWTVARGLGVKKEDVTDK